MVNISKKKLLYKKEALIKINNNNKTNKSCLNKFEIRQIP